MWLLSLRHVARCESLLHLYSVTTKSHTYSNCDNTYTLSWREYTHMHTHTVCSRTLSVVGRFSPTQPLEQTHTSTNTLVRVSHTRLYAHSTIDTQHRAHSGWSCQVGAAAWKESRGRLKGTVNSNLSPQAELIPNCSTGLVLFVLQ